MHMCMLKSFICNHAVTYELARLCVDMKHSDDKCYTQSGPENYSRNLVFSCEKTKTIGPETGEKIIVTSANTASTAKICVPINPVPGNKSVPGTDLFPGTGLLAHGSNNQLFYALQ